jgi:hypothetical protein
MDEYGDWRAGWKTLRGSREGNGAACTLYDYSDYEGRCVWVVPHDGDGRAAAEPDATGDPKYTILAPTENKFPFLPWVARVGGSTLERDEEHKRHPLLYSVYTAGQYHNLNITETLIQSTAISLAGMSRTKEEGGNPQETLVDYDDPSMPAKVPPGNTLNVLIPPPIDPSTWTFARAGRPRSQRAR